MIVSSKLRKGDEVRVIAGGSKGVVGTIVSIDLKNQSAVVNGVELIERHYKANNQNPRGHSKKIAKNIALSNIAIVDSTDSKKISKIGFTIDAKGNKSRVYKSNNKEIK